MVCHYVPLGSVILKAHSGGYKPPILGNCMNHCIYHWKHNCVIAIMLITLNKSICAPLALSSGVTQDASKPTVHDINYLLTQNTIQNNTFIIIMVLIFSDLNQGHSSF